MTTYKDPRADLTEDERHIFDGELPYRPAMWSTWGSAEREAWHTEQSARDEAQGIAESIEAILPTDQQLTVDNLRSAEFAVHAAILDHRLARLKRYRPDLADLFDWAFDEDRDASMKPTADY